MSDGIGTVDRRTVIKSAGGLALSLAVAGHAASPPKRFALVGTGGRSRFYIDAIAGKFRGANELVSLCDTNPGRLALAAKRAMGAPKTYLAADFDTLLRETRPQTAIVTTPDATHDDYIVRALDAGCDVITEKPMTTTPAKAQRIVDACKRNGRHVRVLFTYRYSPPRTQVKDLLMKGEIGDILSVDFHWLLNTQHGADYFRRWHSEKAISGGLMVHKATHHFDLVNGWLGAQPDLEQAYLSGGSMPQGGVAADGVRIRVIALRGAVREIEPWTASGGHGGGDDVMLNDIFGVAEEDPYKRASDERGGAYSILVGAAANRCFETGRSVRIADLVTGLTPPQAAPMPTRASKVPMPRRV